MTTTEIKTFRQLRILINNIDLNKEQVNLILNNKSHRVISLFFSHNEIIDIQRAIINKSCFIEVLTQ